MALRVVSQRLSADSSGRDGRTKGKFPTDDRERTTRIPFTIPLVVARATRRSAPSYVPGLVDRSDRNTYRYQCISGRVPSESTAPKPGCYTLVMDDFDDVSKALRQTKRSRMHLTAGG